MSTFTNGIQRLHGYYRHLDPDPARRNLARLYYTMIEPRDFRGAGSPSWEGEEDVLAITWYHEWPEAWIST